MATPWPGQAGSMDASIIKQCPKCTQQFSVAALLADLSVEVIGMMMLSAGGEKSRYYFFNHNCPGCETSFAVAIEHFAGVLGEDVPTVLLAGTPGCKGHCTRLDDLTLCQAACSNAPFRRFLVNVLLDGRARVRLANGQAVK
jgi:hypothetical protein